jgi:hypothetical protein
VLVISLFLSSSARSVDLALVGADVTAGAPAAAAAPLVVLHVAFTAQAEAAIAFWAERAFKGDVIGWHRPNAPGYGIVMM